MNKIDCYEIPDMDECNGSPKRIIFQICEDIMIFLVLYPIISNILAMFYKSNFVLLQGLSLLIYTILLTLIRIRIKNHILSIILSLTLCCIFIAIPFSNYERILYGIYAALMLINSIKKFFKVNYNFYKLSFLTLSEILLLISVLYAYGINNSSVKHLTLFSALAVLLIFLFYFNVSRYKLLVNSQNRHTGSIATTANLSSKKFVTTLFCVFLTFTCVFLLITNSINSNVDYAIVNTITNILTGKEAPSRTISMDNSSSKDLHKGPNLHQPPKAISHKTSHFNYLLIKLVYIIACLIFSVLILFIIFKIIKSVLALKINDQETEETEATFLKEDFKQDLQHIIPSFNFNLSNKEKLRKYYKKLIKRYRKKGLGIKASSTSRELKDGVLDLTGDDIKDITKIYNKARYSSYEPTKEDIDKLKKM